MSYRYFEPLEIDDLPATMDLATAFALGIEWESFRRRLCGGAPFRTLISDANIGRLQAMAERQGRFCEAHRHCPGYAILVVGAGG